MIDHKDDRRSQGITLINGKTLTRREWLVRTGQMGVVAGTLLSAPAWAQDRPEADAEVLKLGIIHTNDHHGHLESFRANSEDGWGGVARRRVAIVRAHADTSHYWLTLDAGDVFQGTPMSNMLTGFLDLECMNQMGYDAMCLGNHEFDFGYELLRGRFTDVNFPVLCANVIDRERGRPVAEPYTILRRGDYRIGVIGLTTQTLLGETHPSIQDHVLVHPTTGIAKNLAQYLRNIGCHLVIALTHQGYNRDVKMAQDVPELDIIVGGHSHTYLDAPTIVGNTLVTQNGQWGENLGILKLEFARPLGDATARFMLKNFINEYSPMSPDKSEDIGLKALIADYARRFDEEMGRIVCTAAHDFPVDQIRLAENALADMVCDAMKGATESDVVMFNGGNFRAPLFAGEVDFGDLYGVLPYDNFLMKVPVSGSKLREVLSYAGQQYGDGGFPQVAGMSVVYVDMQLAGVYIGERPPTEFDIEWNDGVPLAQPVNTGPDGWMPLDDTREYTMLTNDFLATGGDGFPLKEDPYGVSYTGLEQRATFAKWASQQHTISKQTDGRVQFFWVNMENPGLKD